MLVSHPPGDTSDNYTYHGMTNKGDCPICRQPPLLEGKHPVYGYWGTNEKPDNAGNLYQRDLDFQTQNLAFFAEQLFQIGKKWSIAPGFRAESLQSSISGRSNQVAGGYISGMKKDRYIFLSGLSTKYSLVKLQNAILTLYANANQNYRPVMYSELLPSSTTEIIDSSLRDMTGHSSEGGIKGYIVFKNTMLHYDVNAFYIRYNNKVGTLSLNGAPYKTNIGDLESKGIEFYTGLTLMNLLFKSLPKRNNLTSISAELH